MTQITCFKELFLVKKFVLFVKLTNRDASLNSLDADTSALPVFLSAKLLQTKIICMGSVMGSKSEKALLVSFMIDL